jgi:hypothetical protein
MFDLDSDLDENREHEKEDEPDSPFLEDNYFEKSSKVIFTRDTREILLMKFRYP